MPTSPTVLAIRELKKTGYICQVVEHWNPFAHIRQDLFRCIDIVALHPDKPGVLGIQTTTATNISARLKKSIAIPELATWLKCGNQFEVWGWLKVKNRWQVKKVIC